MPCLRTHSRIARLINSGSLSKRIASGLPRHSISQSSVCRIRSVGRKKSIPCKHARGHNHQPHKKMYHTPIRTNWFVNFKIAFRRQGWTVHKRGLDPAAAMFKHGNPRVSEQNTPCRLSTPKISSISEPAFVDKSIHTVSSKFTFSSGWW